ncbi:hypothetical protein QR680_015487 [Steinernema hermaphroditum]|uniref:Uncharacterized protein n=1 Tax=Steinernema hermaphroditum TaxID=289476 RepID=A0AA39H7V5_9BILA|nr:hypothetical protein QR680_015487 [Steinernema hermaphroditum]
MDTCFWLIFLFILVQRALCDGEENITETSQPGAKYYNGKALVVPIGDEATVSLLQRWHNQAFSGLFAAFANQRLPNLSDDEKTRLQECSSKATEPATQAKCVVEILDAEKIKIKVEQKKKHEGLIVQNELRHKSINYETSSTVAKLLKYEKLRRDYEKKPLLKRFQAVSRLKRAILQRSEYALVSSDEDRTPLGVIANRLVSLVRALKNKNDTASWSSTIVNLHQKAKKIRWEREFERRIRKKLGIDGYTIPEQSAKRVIMSKAGRFTDHPEEDLLREKIEEAGSTINGTSQKAVVEDAIRFLREGIKLALMLTGGNVTDFEKKTVKVASPRFMPVVAEEQDPDTISLLSPSLFGMHDESDGSDEMMSIAKALKVLPNRDQEDWLNLIVEASGVSDQVDRIEINDAKREENRQQSNLNGGPLYFTRQNVSDMYGDFETRKIDVHDEFVRSFTPDQLNKLNETGYAFMNKQQIHHLYGPTSPFNNSETLHRLLSIDDEISEEHIERDLRLVAEMKDFNIRKKDILLSPIVLTPLVLAGAAMSQPIILSPVVLSPAVLSAAALGPVILSPWVFVPVILSPRVLSPLIVNPLIFSPIILSPLALHPLILSPGVFNPLVLSPLLLSPLILSPQVFTPLILSPMCLNPLILNPGVGGPLILSPFVLSPLILSPQALFAVVLSPYALSPLIESKLILSSVVLSPSWLS